MKLNPMSKERMVTPDKLRASIQETRRVYANMTDEQFIAWYHKRYRVDLDVIRWAIGGREGSSHAKPHG
ncbi:hypothetical protein [Gorillibacterium sp. sgz500922]|uniref:hypothetical protein n=1 Tax=Gorillibacterium sp. sgz500922 TaxID=3446694 RepID=UPI003F67015C